MSYLEIEIWFAVKKNEFSRFKKLDLSTGSLFRPRVKIDITENIDNDMR